MSDYINDKELEELNEIYRRKQEMNKHKKPDDKKSTASAGGDARRGRSGGTGREKTGAPDKSAAAKNSAQAVRRQSKAENDPPKKPPEKKSSFFNDEDDRPIKKQSPQSKKSAQPENRAQRSKPAEPEKRQPTAPQRSQQRPLKSYGPDKVPLPYRNTAKSGTQSLYKRLSESEGDKNAKKADEEKKKKLGYIINIGVCGVLFAVTALLLVVLPRPTISEYEKRELAKFPDFSWEDYWNGDYTSDIAEFYDDTIPYRDYFKQMGANFRAMLGFNINGAAIIGDVENVNSDPTQTAVTTQSTKPIVIVTPAPVDSSSPAVTDASGAEDKPDPVPAETDAVPAEYPQPSDPDAQLLHRYGTQLVYYSDDTLYATALYNGSRSYAENYADNLNAIKQSLPDVNVYSLLALTQSTFITPQEFSITTYTEQEDAHYLSTMLSDGIKKIDVLGALYPHLDEKLFFLRDCHWTQLGAYYTAQKFAEEADVYFAPLSDYEEMTYQCLGSVYNSTDYEGLAEAYEDFTFYIPPNSFTVEYYDSEYEYQYDYALMPIYDYRADSFYSLYMVADNYIKHITTDVENGRVLAVIKDDYPSAMIPCLTSSFEEIYVIDVRYCDINVVDFCKEHGVTDLLAGMTVDSAMGDVGYMLGSVR